jgi:hypothetical protein
LSGKRIVFLRPDGIAQIMGTDESFETLPVTAENFVAGGRLVPFASLYRVTPRAAWYKEPIAPGSRTLHEAQR